MKTKFTYFALLLSMTFIFADCRKDKKKPEPETPVEPGTNDPEVITTLSLYIWDSISNTAVTGSPFTFKDPDGDGGQPGGFLDNGTDSVINLLANTTYKTRLVILDETKNPADSISNEIGGDESYEHMFFYNGDPSNSSNSKGNSILHAGYPNYTVKLNGSDIRLRYTDTDNGSAQGKTTRNIGLETCMRTAAATSVKFPFAVTLKHQPGEKDGTYAPGETDISVEFKVKVN